jgi:hypothetical protein
MPMRQPDVPSRHTRLATAIGNRAMQRIAAGETPAGLPAAARALQRDTPKDAEPDPDSGMWFIKFQGSRSSHGDWLPLGNFSLNTTKGSDDGGPFIDVLVASPKGLHLGEALDSEEHLTVVMEQRQHHGSPIRQTIRDAVITSVSETDEVITTGMNPSGTQDLTTKRRVLRVGLRLADTARPSTR